MTHRYGLSSWYMAWLYHCVLSSRHVITRCRHSNIMRLHRHAISRWYAMMITRDDQRNDRSHWDVTIIAAKTLLIAAAPVPDEKLAPPRHHPQGNLDHEPPLDAASRPSHGTSWLCKKQAAPSAGVLDEPYHLWRLHRHHPRRQILPPGRQAYSTFHTLPTLLIRARHVRLVAQETEKDKFSQLQDSAARDVVTGYLFSATPHLPGHLMTLPPTTLPPYRLIISNSSRYHLIALPPQTKI